MNRNKTLSACVLVAVAALLVIFSVSPSGACTNLLVSKGASADGSTFITYSADAHNFYGDVAVQPARIHPKGAMRDIYEWDRGKFLGRSPTRPDLHRGSHERAPGGHRRDHIRWSRGAGGRERHHRLRQPHVHRPGAVANRAGGHPGDGGVLAEYGYASSGESFSISDPHEVWILEMIGKGPEEKGAVWVARRVPDGYISGHANQARIRSFPLDKPDECLYAEDTIDFARKQGWFDGRRRGLQLHRHLCAAHLRRHPFLRGPGLECFPPCRALAGSSPSTPWAGEGSRAVSAVDQAGSASSPSTTSWS